VRCPRCGNENSEQNRFCGMCGATLLSEPEPVAKQPQSVATAKPATSAAETPALRPQVVDTPRSAAPRDDDAPGISGPSFLGLNDPPPPRKRGGLSIDPHETGSSRNLNYLLDDEDEPRSSGAGKFVVILVALALAAGLGYLRWRNHGFGWLDSASKPSPAAPNTDDSSSPTPAPDSQPSAAAPAMTPAPGQPTKTPPASSANPSAAATPTPAPATASTQPPPSSSTPVTTDAPKPADATPPTTTPPATNADKTTSPASSGPVPASKQPSSDDSDAESPSDQPKSAADEPLPKPAPTKPVDPVAEAQRYLYGRGGVTQNCDRGLRLLKGPANQGNTKAMVEMGALYSAGLCTPHDLPTAYRWFALALRKDPDNQSVQADLQKLWGEMTQPERKLAIQLTQ
jgi:hypothetical protein